MVRQFVSVLINALPEIPNDIILGWAEHPHMLAEVLQGLVNFNKFPVSFLVDMRKNLEQMLSESRLGGQYHSTIIKHFSHEPAKKKVKVVGLLARLHRGKFYGKSWGKLIDKSAVEQELVGWPIRGWRLANIQELLSFITTYPEALTKDGRIFSLGSHFSTKGEHEYFPYLNISSAESGYWSSREIEIDYLFDETGTRIQNGDSFLVVKV